MWGMDEARGLNAKNDRSKKVVRMHHNPTKQDTYSDAGQTINGDFPTLFTDCEKAV